MLTGMHFLLTYQCLYECDHCFLYCGPQLVGTFTLDQVEAALRQGGEAGVDTVYYEGGEPFLYYPLLLESMRLAKSHGMKCGVVTNCYWAGSARDAELWLQPLIEIGIDDLWVSNDSFHSEDLTRNPAQIVCEVASRLGMPVESICIEAPTGTTAAARARGEPVTGGDVIFKGRAVEKLGEGLPRRHYSCFTECTQEELVDPSRIHLDPFGNVFVCQGLSIGNIWQKPLQDIMADFTPARHPVIGPLIQGGPARLAEVFGLPEGEEYISDCHLCYLIRKKLLDRFPAYLCPAQVYGVEP